MIVTPKIAISSCLAGQAVRYDGSDRHFDYFHKKIFTRFNVLTICPEVGIGLPVPRQAIQIVSIGSKHILRAVDDPRKHYTSKMLSYAKQMLPYFDDVCGYIVKQRSPSCGVNDTAIFSNSGVQIAQGTGLFSAAIIRAYPCLPIIDEVALSNDQQRDNFWERVYIMHLFYSSTGASCDRSALQKFYNKVESHILLRGQQSLNLFYEHIKQTMSQSSVINVQQALSYLMQTLTISVSHLQHRKLLQFYLNNTSLPVKDKNTLINGIDFYDNGNIPLWSLIKLFNRILNKNNKSIHANYFFPSSRERELRSSTFY